MKELTKSEEQMMDILGQQGGTDQCRYCKNAGESNLDKWAGT